MTEHESRTVYRLHSTVEMPLETVYDYFEDPDLPEGIVDIEITRRNNTLIIDAVPEDDSIGKYTPTAQLKATVSEKRVEDEEAEPPESDGGLTVDATGSSSAGLHAYNAAEGALTGGMWVYLTQKILHEAKVNDGSHLAIDTQFPPGSIVNPQDPDLSYHTSWGTLMPTFNSMAQGLNRSIYCRGFVEEAAAGFNSHGDVLQGGGELNMTGDEFPIASMDATTMGQSGSPVRDGEHVQFSLFNPETDINDIEEAELMEGAVPYLSRKIKPDTAGHGKYRGGACLEIVRTIVGADVSIYKQMHPGETFFSSGLAGGYPAATSYNVRAHDTNLMELIHKDEPYPIDDSPPGSLEENLEGDIVRNERAAYFPTEFDQFDLFYMQSTGGHGWGDPLERPLEKLKEDVELEVYTPETVESVYGV